jgi:hypothetical protein
MTEPTAHAHPSDEWYVVFDRKDGHVIHLHQFICPADVEHPMGARSREAAALGAARERFPSADLHVMAVPRGHRIEAGVTYRVDAESGRLVEAARLRPHALHMTTPR